MSGERLDIAVLGAGALGSILGAHLARAGHHVTLLARGQRAQQIRAQGLRIEGLARFVEHVELQVEPTQFRGADVLIVATKTHGTAAALEPLRPAVVGCVGARAGPRCHRQHERRIARGWFGAVHTQRRLVRRGVAGRRPAGGGTDRPRLA